MTGFLAAVVDDKIREIAELTAYEHSAAFTRTGSPPRGFAAAVADGGIIAELKRRSPTVASFPRGDDPLAQALTYAAHGAAAVSIVTDTPRFGMVLAEVATVRDAIALPVLVKDFLIDVVQVRAAWAAGADAVLLIARIVDDARLAELHAEAKALGLDALVECHDEADLEKARRLGAPLVGINSRDLDTLHMSAGGMERMIALKPEGCLMVAESGMTCRDDIETMAALGADAFLIGSVLLAADDPGHLLDQLRGATR